MSVAQFQHRGFETVPTVRVVFFLLYIVNAMRNPPRPERTLSIGSTWRGGDCICYALSAESRKDAVHRKQMARATLHKPRVFD